VVVSRISTHAIPAFRRATHLASGGAPRHIGRRWGCGWGAGGSVDGCEAVLVAALGDPRLDRSGVDEIAEGRQRASIAPLVQGAEVDGLGGVAAIVIDPVEHRDAFD
jgi:hypothetical protein